jgi:hypothetical protein
LAQIGTKVGTFSSVEVTIPVPLNDVSSEPAVLNIVRLSSGSKMGAV